MARTGRPRIEIDKAQFENLCRIMCTEEEIASWFKCSVPTIDRWCKRTYNQNFEDIYKKEAAAGKISLRRSQIQLAKKSPAMAIFLGKNYLGQRDHKELEISRPVDDTVAEMEAYFAEQDAGQEADI